MYEIYVNGEFKGVVYADHVSDAISKYKEICPTDRANKIKVVYLHRKSK